MTTAMRRTKNPFDDDSMSDAQINGVQHDGMSQSSSTSSLFPAGLSSWMSAAMTSFSSPSTNNTTHPQGDGKLETGPGKVGHEDDDDDGDESLYHDCNSTVLTDSLEDISSLDDIETTRLLPSQTHTSSSHRQKQLRRQRNNVYHATSSATPIRGNHDERSRIINEREAFAVVGNDDHGEANPQNTHHSIASPLAHALATWLSPYADSAKRAGRKYNYFLGNESNVEERQNTSNLFADDGKPDFIDIEEEKSVVREELLLCCERNGSGIFSTGLLNRVRSSPALTTSTLDQTSDLGGNKLSSFSSQRHHSDNSSIVLKDIHFQGENHDSEYGTLLYPWTKLILLEELGTAWSWFVLLLPYIVLIFAVVLDGDTKLKSTVVGPLHGTIPCASLVGGSVPTPYDSSVKGYFPVPFRFAAYNTSQSNTTVAEAKLYGSCSYPFELREGVGLLSHRLHTESTMVLSPRTSIIEPRYRYIMSHGHAFTSGVISNVPPTAQSLTGSVNFKNLSSNAVSLVASGSVLVSVIVFQRPGTSYDETVTNDTSSNENDPWSPVLILSSKRLEMMCKLNSKRSETNSDARTWNCSSRGVIDAFFSLPNAAVLMGGDLRVDVLLVSHRNTRQQDGHGGSKGTDDDYIIRDASNDIDLSEEEKILLTADTSHPQQLLEELTTKSVFKMEHESISYDRVVEGTRIVLLTITSAFICFWRWKIQLIGDITRAEIVEDASRYGRTFTLAHKLRQALSRMWFRNEGQIYQFWWQDPWITFPERRYLLALLYCLVVLQNPLLVYAYFVPTLYSSPRFRFAADSISSISVHGILFLWLCLVQGLRYHTADIARRRFDQHRRVLELRKATSHITPTEDIEDHQWGHVKWYYQQYGDVDGGGNSMALIMKHDIHSGSFAEFVIPKLSLLLLGTVASVLAAASRFPKSVSNATSDRTELNPDRFGSGGKVYVLSCVVQIVVIQIWCLSIVHASFVTGERLRKEPFLSTRPSQLAFRVLSGILLLGLGFCIVLFYFQSLHLTGNDGNNIAYTTTGGYDDTLDSKAELWIKIIHRATTEIPYIGTASNIGPGKIMYATACSLVVAYMFLPSSHFDSSNIENRSPDEIAIGPDQHSNVLSDMADMVKRYQGKDKRSVVALARNTHTWRVFPLPTRSHSTFSQHTLKEKLNMIGTFQLKVNGQFFTLHRNRDGQGTIYKGIYVPVFCVEIACWLLEASWQSYYSPMEYSVNSWAPGRMRLDSIGLKLEHAIHDNETDTHGFVASNISEQVEGEEDSIIVVAFRGSASMHNIIETDLSFRQVPLPERMMSDIPAFNIRPGQPIAVDESAWDTNISLSSILKDILRPQSALKISSWSTFPSVSSMVDTAELNSPQIPTVSTGAKEIIRATPMARQALPCVHEGFLRNYSKVRHELIVAILSVFKRQLDKSVERCRQHDGSSCGLDSQPLTLPKLYITGHSMGGAFAQLLAIDLASNCEIVIEQSIISERYGINAPQRNRTPTFDADVTADMVTSDADGENYWFGPKLRHKRTATRLRPPIAVYTYGQPRLGNNAFKAIYKRRVPHTFRVSTEGDAITSMLTVGPFCGGIYRHAGLEVLLEEGCTGNILVGPTVVETLLRFTKVRTSVAAHSLEKYRESLESALDRDELKEYYCGHGGKVRHESGNSGNSGNLPSWVTSVKRSHEQ